MFKRQETFSYLNKAKLQIIFYFDNLLCNGQMKIT